MKKEWKTIARNRAGTMMGASALLLLSAGVAFAAVTTVVTHVSTSPDPAPPKIFSVGETITPTFSASSSGYPTNNQECEINNKRYSWTDIAVEGPNGTQPYPDNLNGSSGGTYALGHTVNYDGGYIFRATCTITYDSSAECGGSNQKTESTPASVMHEIRCNDGTCMVQQ
jgi:hypothetical protein